MLLSYNWLKELIPDLTASPKAVAELLTKHSFETVIKRQLKIDSQITVAQITKLEPHPNADRLQLATINNGQDTVTVVCGASNIEEGDIVPYSPPGATLRDEKGQSFKVKEATIRGQSSPGMLNSPRELGLGENHTGIYILPSDTPVGTKLSDHIPPDTILDADITPNRAHDCLSHIGLAREVAAILDLVVTEPKFPALKVATLAKWELDINIPNKVPRYLGAELTDVSINPSPLWLQAKLWSMGSKPINNVVDITNYVLFEYGNPIHAFDIAKLPGQKIGVRLAREKEFITTLDKNKRQLAPDNLIITSDDQPVAVAGVMGGASSEVRDNTDHLFLEVANFAPYTIQQSSTALKIETESSTRFKKGITPALVEPAASRTIQLLTKLAGAKLKGIIEYYPRPVTPPTISFNPKRVSKVSGKDIPDKQAQAILINLRCQVDSTNTPWTITPPVERLDLTGEHDLIEEIIRVTGLDTIAAKQPAIVDQPPALSHQAQWREIIRDLLVSYGLTETYNYSFEDDKMLELLNVKIAAKQRLSLVNPVSPEQKYMRTTLLPRLMQNLLANKAQLKKKFSGTERDLFEISSTFLAGDTGLVSGVIEDEHVAGVLVGERATAVEVKSIIEAIMALMGITHNPSDLYTITELESASKLRQKIGLAVFMFEFSLSKFIEHAELTPNYTPSLSNQTVQYEAPSKYPPSYRDLSILIDPNVTIEQVQEIIERVGGDLVVDVDLFDVYDAAGDSAATDQAPRKSLAFHIAYQSPAKTLTDDEVGKLHNKIVSTLQAELHAQLRE